MARKAGSHPGLWRDEVIDRDRADRVGPVVGTGLVFR